MERITIEKDGQFVPKALCTIGRDGQVDDCDGCIDYCKQQDIRDNRCPGCAIQECFDRLGVYEDMHEKIEHKIKEIKSSSDYPHNFKGQMVEDLEWVLKQLI